MVDQNYIKIEQDGYTYYIDKSSTTYLSMFQNNDPIAKEIPTLNYQVESDSNLNKVKRILDKVENKDIKDRVKNYLAKDRKFKQVIEKHNL